MQYRWQSVLLIVLGTVVPLYTVRFHIGPIGTNMMEILWFSYCFGYLGTQIIRSGWDRFFTNYLRQESIVLIGLLCIGLIGLFTTSELIASLGVFKSYIILPIISYIVLRAHSQTQIYHIISGVLISGLVMTSISGYQLFVLGFHRPTAWYSIGLDPNVSQGGFANYIALYLTAIIWLGVSFKDIHKSIQYLVSGILLLGIILTQSYIALFAMGVTGILYGVSQYQHGISRRSALLLGIFLTIIVIGLSFWQVSTPKFQALIDPNTRNSITTRLQIWHTSVNIIQDNPLFGIGLSDFQRVYTETVPELYFPPYEWLVPEPHNTYLSLFMKAGIIGLLWGLGILIYSVHLVMKWFRSQNLPLALALITPFIYGLMDTAIWKNDLIMVFVLVVSIIQLIEKENK